jgi:DNA-directed RNA polymerase specialized sigma24 family protein
MNVINPLRIEAGQSIHRPNHLAGDDLRKRIALLDKDDQLLVELVTNLGASHRKIAQFMGLEPGTVSRRVRRVWQRLADPIVTRLLARDCPLGPEYRQIGIEHLLVARSTARIAAEHEMSPQAVRAAIAYVRTWHRLTRPGARGEAAH